MTDHTRYDYNSLIERLTTLISEKENFGDAYNSSQIQLLIQLFADASDSLAYMLERRDQERYLSTARLGTSIRANANARGFRPRRRVSSSGTARIRLTDNDGNTITPDGNIFIERYSRITFRDQTFVNLEDIIITPNDSEIQFPIMEGRPRSETYPTGQGSFFHENGYILLSDYENIEDGSIVITDVDGNEWHDVRSYVDNKPPIQSLAFAEPEDRYFDLRISNDGLRIIFGNDNFGMRPTSSLIVEWVESKGEEVVIERTGLEFQLEQSTLEDDINVIPPNTYDYEIVNTTPIRGGLEAETDDDIRLKAPEYSKTGERAVTKDDYVHWVLRSGIGGIVDALCYGEQETGINFYHMNNIFVSYLTNHGGELTPQEEEELRTFMSNYEVAVPHIVFSLVDKIFVQMNIRIAKNRGLRVSDAEVYTHIRNFLKDQFVFEEGSIGERLYHSALLRELQRLTITRDGLTQRVADYLDLEINALFPFESPIEDNEIVIEITPRIVGDDYVLSFDENFLTGESTDFLYTQVLGDTGNSIAQALATMINDHENFEAFTDGSVLTVRTAIPDGSFTVSNHKSTVPENVGIIQEISIPPRLLNNRFDEDMILRGSANIIDEEGNVIYEDNGSGEIGPGTINYVTAKVRIPILSPGRYYVRYKEDDFSNLEPNERTVLDLSEPKELLTDPVNLLSTIEFVD